MFFPAWFHALDLRLLYLINQTWSRPWLDPVMARVSDFDSFKIPLAIAIVLILIFGGFRGRLLLVMMAACLLIGDALIDHGFKDTVRRPRRTKPSPHLRVVTVHDITESAPQPMSSAASRSPRGMPATTWRWPWSVARSLAGGRSGFGPGRHWSAIRGFMSGRIIRATSSAPGSSRFSIPTSS